MIFKVKDQGHGQMLGSKGVLCNVFLITDCVINVIQYCSFCCSLIDCIPINVILS